MSCIGGIRKSKDTESKRKAAPPLLNRWKILWIVGTAVHTVTKSIYLKDPDGNELELYVDVSDEWKKNPSVVLSPAKALRL